MASMSSAPAPNPSTANPRAGRGRWKMWLAVTAALLAGLVIWNYPAWKAQAEVGSAYAARMACSCRYVQGRDLDSCLTDFDPGTEIVSVSEIAGEQRIEASVPMLANRTARFAGASGCLLEDD